MEIASFIVGLIGVLLAIYFYIKGKKRRHISYTSRSFNLVSDSISLLPRLTIYYDHNIINNLTASKVLLQNRGNCIINASDISDADPLKIVLDDNVSIFDAKVYRSSDPTNLVEVSLDSSSRNKVHISFEYLAQKQGCVINLLHTGTDKTSLKVNGTIKGGNLSKKIDPEKLSQIAKFTRLWATTGSFLSLVVLVFYAYVLLGEPSLDKSLYILLDPIWILVLLFLLSVLPQFIHSWLQERFIDSLRIIEKPFSPVEYR